MPDERFHVATTRPQAIAFGDGVITPPAGSGRLLRHERGRRLAELADDSLGYLTIFCPGGEPRGLLRVAYP